MGEQLLLDLPSFLWAPKVPWSMSPFQPAGKRAEKIKAF
jgi:hypothetical protein